jgi:hypothetical protein
MADAEVEDDRDEASRFEEHDRRWWEIPDSLLHRCSAPFFFLAVEDFTYYLPAYMSWVVRTEGQAKSSSVDFLVYYLQDSARGGRLVSLLTTQQSAAVSDFLEWVVSNYHLESLRNEASSALEETRKRRLGAEPAAASDAGPARPLGNSATQGGLHR